MPEIHFDQINHAQLPCIKFKHISSLHTCELYTFPAAPPPLRDQLSVSMSWPIAKELNVRENQHYEYIAVLFLNEIDTIYKSIK